MKCKIVSELHDPVYRGGGIVTQLFNIGRFLKVNHFLLEFRYFSCEKVLVQKTKNWLSMCYPISMR